MENIMRHKLNEYILKTVDVVFLDEAGQISAEQVYVMDIIFRKLRQSRSPFGGVLFIGTMDHTQI